MPPSLIHSNLTLITPSSTPYQWVKPHDSPFAQSSPSAMGFQGPHDSLRFENRIGNDSVGSPPLTDASVASKRPVANWYRDNKPEIPERHASVLRPRRQKEYTTYFSRQSRSHLFKRLIHPYRWAKCKEEQRQRQTCKESEMARTIVDEERAEEEEKVRLEEERDKERRETNGIWWDEVSRAAVLERLNAGKKTVKTRRRLQKSQTTAGRDCISTIKTLGSAIKVRFLDWTTRQSVGSERRRGRLRAKKGKSRISSDDPNTIYIPPSQPLEPTPAPPPSPLMNFNDQTEIGASYTRRGLLKRRSTDTSDTRTSSIRRSHLLNLTDPLGGEDPLQTRANSIKSSISSLNLPAPPPISTSPPPSQSRLAQRSTLPRTPPKLELEIPDEEIDWGDHLSGRGSVVGRVARSATGSFVSAGSWETGRSTKVPSEQGTVLSAREYIGSGVSGSVRSRGTGYSGSTLADPDESRHSQDGNRFGKAKRYTLVPASGAVVSIVSLKQPSTSRKGRPINWHKHAVEKGLITLPPILSDPGMQWDY
jgi:hypothetical protein